MSTLAVEQTSFQWPEPEQTLDAVIAIAWTELSSHRAADCPICHGEMAPEYGARALPIAGRCRDCGAALS